MSPIPESILHRAQKSNGFLLRLHSLVTLHRAHLAGTSLPPKDSHLLPKSGQRHLACGLTLRVSAILCREELAGAVGLHWVCGLKTNQPPHALLVAMSQDLPLSPVAPAEVRGGEKHFKSPTPPLQQLLCFLLQLLPQLELLPGSTHGHGPLHPLRGSGMLPPPGQASSTGWYRAGAILLLACHSLPGS